jgi:RNA polymerase-binding transcription factor DksA
MQNMVLERLPDTRERLRRRLEAIGREMEELRRDLVDATRSQLLEGTLANHPADEASDLIVAESDVSRMRDLLLEIRDINDALERIDAATYGVCLQCGADIDPARLKVLPLATRCLRCQTHYDLTST